MFRKITMAALFSMIMFTGQCLVLAADGEVQLGQDERGQQASGDFGFAYFTKDSSTQDFLTTKDVNGGNDLVAKSATAFPENADIIRPTFDGTNMVEMNGRTGECLYVIEGTWIGGSGGSGDTPKTWESQLDSNQSAHFILYVNDPYSRLDDFVGKETGGEASITVEIRNTQPGLLYTAEITQTPVEGNISLSGLPTGETSISEDFPIVISGPDLYASGEGIVELSSKGGGASAPVTGAKLNITSNLAIFHIVDQNGAVVFGHSGALIPGTSGKYYYYSFGPSGLDVRGPWGDAKAALAKAKARGYTHGQWWYISSENAAKACAAMAEWHREHYDDYEPDKLNCWHCVANAFNEGDVDFANNADASPRVNYRINIGKAEESGVLP